MSEHDRKTKMTRLEFVRAFAARSGITDDFADLGALDFGGTTRFALPCGCLDEKCVGWAMISADHALSHLELYAPPGLRAAYNESVLVAGGTGSGFKSIISAALDRADDQSLAHKM